ncbi:Peptidase S9A/B/C family, catalytic domain protein [Candidatus Promineifilum breve]|uniref:Peptidase S9A/B/C family, catalytic domain protein n=1 Tax=Candidatus Promineifilum breve TaxID=1806508 RepID=A0A160T147_9CHLR|nr:prolyl oligopeptidase family serine peptidase [Candidatus Promineifilum breve]CUS03546.2 Peptidase S9A/B/C family, catalytic domain protein [Candidatus Promineifilum breve]
MTEPTIAPYGSWKSPITADLLLGGSVGLAEPFIDGDAIYWVEARPREAGRNVIVRWAAGEMADVTPPGYNARTRVHEYGGGDFIVHEGIVYFANDADQRVYRQRPGAAPEALTPEAALRYADFILDPARDRLICVREDHRPAGHEAINTLVAVPLGGGEQIVLAEGYDFYAAPRLSPDGRRLAWLAWRHPNMPWDGTELWLAGVAEDGTLTDPTLVAGGPDESIFQPTWSPDGVLHFISDRSGWWNLYRLAAGEEGDVPAERLYALDADFGMAQWVFGLATYAFESPTSLICAYTQNGRSHLARLDTATGELAEFDLPYTLKFPSHGRIVAGDGFFVYVGGSPVLPSAMIRVEAGVLEVLHRSTDLQIKDAYTSIARPVEFPTEGGLTAHGYFYPPRNRDYAAPAGELPPLIVTSHGGPTSATTGDLSLDRQYWTSRGFAILDVNYGGSTGYGRAYRQRLNGQWGIVDVEDCVNGARYLVERGLVDGERLIIRGGSAGGYTTLCAITGGDTFRAAASYFGVSDAEALARDTHKFESRYSDNLIAPYPAGIDIYRARSPLHVAHNCTAALILFQGLEDKVVPPDQSEAMFTAARNRELPVAYIAFPGEGHGFRQAATLKRAMEAELYFYGRVLGFEPADTIEPVTIENL